MLEKIAGVPQRIADLKRKLAARKGKKEFIENYRALEAEIARLEVVSAKRADLVEFLTEEAPVASQETPEVQA